MFVKISILPLLKAPRYIVAALLSDFMNILAVKIPTRCVEEILGIESEYIMPDI